MSKTKPFKMKVIAAVLVALIACFAIFFAPDDNDPKPTKVNANAAEKMQKMVIGLSNYSKKLKPGFLVIPQNGIELAYKKADPKLGLYQKYLDAIDGFGVEELFYFETLAIDTFRLEAIRRIPGKKFLVSDFVTDDSNVQDAKDRNLKEGFIPFVRSKSNYHYQIVPDKIIDKNSDDVTNMSEVKNYLYLINPSEFDTKDDYVEAIANTDYDLITVDLFFDKYNPMTPADVQRLKKKANGGKRLVICYMNIGAAENWRYYWRPDWKLGDPSWLKKAYEGYDNEIYVEYWNPVWQKIIFGNDDSYLKKIIEAGFDGCYLDNTEAYYELYRN